MVLVASLDGLCFNFEFSLLCFVVFFEVVACDCSDECDEDSNNGVADEMWGKEGFDAVVVEETVVECFKGGVGNKSIGEDAKRKDEEIVVGLLMQVSVDDEPKDCNHACKNDSPGDVL